MRKPERRLPSIRSTGSQRNSERQQAHVRGMTDQRVVPSVSEGHVRSRLPLRKKHGQTRGEDEQSSHHRTDRADENRTGSDVLRALDEWMEGRRSDVAK